MARKQRKPSKQEKALATFSQNSISAYSTFYPNQWGNGREPADLIVVIGKALLFINATEGKSWFDDLCKHNITQAEDRVKDWQENSNLTIKGKNEHRVFNISWSEIEVIAVISVVDGRHAACINHPLEELQFPEKVKICSSITSGVFYELAKKGGSASDLVWLCKSLIGKGRQSETVTCKLVKSHYTDLAKAAMAKVLKEPTRLGKALVGGKEVNGFEEFRHMLTVMKSQGHKASDVFSDLSWKDFFPAVAFINDVIARIEYRDEGAIASSFFGEITKFAIVVSSNSEGLLSNMDTFLLQPFEKGAQFVFIVQLHSIGPVCSCAINPNAKIGATEYEIASLDA